MQTTERHILMNLQHLIHQLPTNMTKKDYRYINIAAHRIIANLIEAEEPIHSTRSRHARAQDITKNLRDFLEYRQKERWCLYSTHSYAPFDERQQTQEVT